MISVTGIVAAGWTLPVGQRGCAGHARGRVHRDIARVSNLFERAELARLQDDLEMGRSAGALDLTDLLRDLGMAAFKPRAARDDHVDLVGAVGDGARAIGQAKIEWILPARKARRDTRNLDA